MLELHDLTKDFSQSHNIAEEGFIYGLPIVMNYAVMNEYAVDRNSGQFKAPFNSIFNDAKVFAYKDKRTDDRVLAVLFSLSIRF